MNDPQISFIIMRVVGKYLQTFLYNLSSNLKVCLSNQYRFLDQNLDQILTSLLESNFHILMKIEMRLSKFTYFCNLS